jgi:hypothetical protein
MTRDFDIVVPGLRLCEADERHVAGPGTYAQHGYIYSSLLGELRLVNIVNNAVSVEVRATGGLGSLCHHVRAIHSILSPSPLLPLSSLVEKEKGEEQIWALIH